MKRKSVLEVLPKTMDGMLELEKYIRSTSLNRTIRELIKIRASELNGCAYCMDMHTEEAMKLGETPRRIFATSTWRESPLFTKEERIALKLTEEVTRIGKEGVTDETYEAAINTFGEEGTAQVILQAVIINIWNRFAVAGHSVYESEEDKKKKKAEVDA
ncbi:MAG: carboxymuconolactone decarboxylase family protein [Chitinophagaceae bacterium]|nr:carboxymuconolactone decarboxylase family protein [Chitinophagaceae bacterium]